MHYYTFSVCHNKMVDVSWVIYVDSRKKSWLVINRLNQRLLCIKKKRKRELNTATNLLTNQNSITQPLIYLRRGQNTIMLPLIYLQRNPDAIISRNFIIIIQVLTFQMIFHVVNLIRKVSNLSRYQNWFSHLTQWDSSVSRSMWSFDKNLAA